MGSKIKILPLVLAVFIVVGMLGCSPAPQATAPAAPVANTETIAPTVAVPDIELEGLPNPGPKDKYVFYFSQRAMNHPWNVAMTTSFDTASKKYADRISKYVWTDGNNDDAKQLADIEDMIKTKPDVLFLSAQSFESLAVVANLAKENGVALFAIDRRINAEPGKDYPVWIGGDYRDQGRLAAQELLAQLFAKTGAYKGNIVEIAGSAGASAAIDRAAGFADEIAKYPDVKIIASQDGEFARDKALTVMENYLQKYKAGEIDAVYTHNDEMAIGAVEAIEKAGRNELLGWIVSVDGQREALKLVIDGKMLATAQCPAGYGELAFQTALDYLDGKPVQSEIYIPFEAFSNRTPELLQRTQEYYKFEVDNDLQY